MEMGVAPWWPCFLTDQNNLNNFGKRSLKEHLCEIIFKLGQWFWTRRFLKFALKYSLFTPFWPLCSMDQNHLNKSERGPPREHSGGVLVEIGPGVWEEMSFEAIVDDERRTTDIKWSQKLTLSAMCSGELKIFYSLLVTVTPPGQREIKVLFCMQNSTSGPTLL